MSTSGKEMKLVLLEPASITASQLAELVELVPKTFSDFNKSLTTNVHPSLFDEDFGDTALAPAVVESITKTSVGLAAVDVESGKIVGVTFIDIRANGSKVAAIGPVSSIVPGAGRKTFDAACAHAEKLGFTVLVLQQIAANTRSFSLYAKLGFQAKHLCHYFGGFLTSDGAAVANGDAGEGGSTYTVTEMTENDVEECAALYVTAHGPDCGWDRQPAIAASLNSGAPFPMLVARDADGKLIGYSTGFFIDGHQVTESEEVFKALFKAASRIHQEQSLPTPRFHTVMDYPDLVTWALAEKLLLLRANVLMARGPYEHAWPGNRYVVTPSIGGW